MSIPETIQLANLGNAWLIAGFPVHFHDSIIAAVAIVHADECFSAWLHRSNIIDLESMEVHADAMSAVTAAGRLAGFPIDRGEW